MSQSRPGNLIQDVDETSLSHMLRLATPMVISTISFTIMQFVDRLMVSRLGTNELAAILPAAFVTFVPGGFAMGAVSSLNTYVSQSIGQGRDRDCAHYFWQTVYMGLAYFITVTIICWPLSPWIFSAFGQSDQVTNLAVIYFRIMLYAHLPAVFNWSYSQFFMGIHKPIIIMIASLIGQGVNIFANWVLIFGKLGMRRMEIAGAGWGTFIGISVGALVSSVVFFSGAMDRRFGTRTMLSVNISKMRDLIKVGVPAGVGMMVSVALWGVVLSGLVGRFGKEALAATSAVLSYTNLSVMPVVGISTALTAVVGKAIGSGRKELATKQTSLCLKIALIYMGTVGVCFFIFRNSLMVFWSTDPKVIDIGSRILICAAFYQAFHAARIIYGGALRGAGDTMWLAFISSVSAVGVLGFGGVAFILFVPSAQAIGPWMAATLSIVIVGIANHWRFKSNRWMKIDLFKQSSISIPSQTKPSVQ